MKTIVKSVVSLQAEERQKPLRFNSEKSQTVPDMNLSIKTIIDRSMRGMEIQGRQPVFNGEAAPEFVGYENLSKIEKIEFARNYKKRIESEISAFNEEQKKRVSDLKGTQEKAAFDAALAEKLKKEQTN